MINLEKIKKWKSGKVPALSPFKKTCPCTILPPSFFNFSDSDCTAFFDSSNDSGQRRVMFLRVRAKILELWLAKVFTKSLDPIMTYDF